MTDKETLYHEKGRKALTTLLIDDTWNLTRLATAIDWPTSNTHGIISYYESLGIVTRKREGRSKTIRLTEDGAKIARTIADLDVLIEEVTARPPIQVQYKKKRKRKPRPKRMGLRELGEALLGLQESMRAGTRPPRVCASILGLYRGKIRRKKPKTPEGRKTKEELLELCEEIHASLKGIATPKEL